MKSFALLLFILSPCTVLPMYTDQSWQSNAKFDEPVHKNFAMFPNNFLGVERLSKRFLRQEDVVIVLDGSASISSCLFEKQKRVTMLKVIKAGSEDLRISSRYAAVTVSSSAKVNFNFLPSAQAIKKMNAISQPDGSTNTHAGLKKAANLFRTGNYRILSRKVVILFTDGQSDNKQKTLDAAKELKKIAQIFVIGIGKYGNWLDEIVKMASYPPEKFVFHIDKKHRIQLALHKVNSGKYKLAKPSTSACL